MTDQPDRIAETPAEFISDGLDHAWFAKKRMEEIAADRSGEQDGEMYHQAQSMVDQFNAVLLMETLRRVAPEAAAHAAQVMHDLADYGDNYHEIIFEWRDFVAKGKPIVNDNIFPEHVAVADR